MPISAIPRMLSTRGAPFLSETPQWTDGEVWFVHNGRGSNNNDGRK